MHSRAKSNHWDASLVLSFHSVSWSSSSGELQLDGLTPSVSSVTVVLCEMKDSLTVETNTPSVSFTLFQSDDLHQPFHLSVYFTEVKSKRVTCFQPEWKSNLTVAASVPCSPLTQIGDSIKDIWSSCSEKGKWVFNLTWMIVSWRRHISGIEQQEGCGWSFFTSGENLFENDFVSRACVNSFLKRDMKSSSLVHSLVLMSSTKIFAEVSTLCRDFNAEGKWSNFILLLIRCTVPFSLSLLWLWTI